MIYVPVLTDDMPDALGEAFDVYMKARSNEKLDLAIEVNGL